MLIARSVLNKRGEGNIRTSIPVHRLWRTLLVSIDNALGFDGRVLHSCVQRQDMQVMGYGNLYTVEHHVGLSRPEEARHAPLWASVQNMQPE